MKLKCIGGPNNGEYHIVDDLHHVGDAWKVKQKNEYKVSFDMPLPDEMPEFVTEKYEIYIIDRMSYIKPDRKTFWVQFLRYEKDDKDKLMEKILKQTFT